jgi:hypothetical protein
MFTVLVSKINHITTNNHIPLLVFIFYSLYRKDSFIKSSTTTSMIMIQKSFGFVLTFILVTVNAVIAAVEQPQQQQQQQRWLSPRPRRTSFLGRKLGHHAVMIRGGAGPIDPDMMCKIGAGVAIAQGAVAAVAPKQMSAAYGFTAKDNDAAQQYHMKNWGTGVLSLGVMFFLVSTDEIFFERIMTRLRTVFPNSFLFLTL